MAGVSETHPRPQLQRAHWESLDGRWDFALDPEGDWSLPGEVTWDRSIIVPFAPETLLSGVAAEGFFRSCWYRRTVEIAAGARWGAHIPHVRGGRSLRPGCGSMDRMRAVTKADTRRFRSISPISCSPVSEHEIIVCAEDDPHDLAKPRGKQDWQLEPHSIWYPRTTGIWQTVWLERRPASWIDSLRWIPGLAAWDIACEVVIEGE